MQGPGALGRPALCGGRTGCWENFTGAVASLGPRETPLSLCPISTRTWLLRLLSLLRLEQIPLPCSSSLGPWRRPIQGRDPVVQPLDRVKGAGSAHCWTQCSLCAFNVLST